MGRLDGKVAFITGAGSGIARSATLLFTQEGAKVVIAELKPELGQATEDLVRDAGGDATCMARLSGLPSRTNRASVRFSQNDSSCSALSIGPASGQPPRSWTRGMRVLLSPGLFFHYHTASHSLKVHEKLRKWKRRKRSELKICVF